MRPRRFLIQAICVAFLSLGWCSAAQAVSPIADVIAPRFTYVAPSGHVTLPKTAAISAEHFTFSLLSVQAGQNGKQVVAAIRPYAAPSCLAKQQVILNKMGPALTGLSVVIDGAKQVGPKVMDVTFGGTDQMTQYAIYGLVKAFTAKMRIGLSHTGAGWEVTSARILDASHSKPACT